MLKGCFGNWNEPGIPKNRGQRLAAPINFRLFQHVVKRLLDVKHMYGCRKPQVFSTWALHHAWVEVARIFQEVQAKGAVDGKPKLIKKIVFSNISTLCVSHPGSKGLPRFHLSTTTKAVSICPWMQGSGAGLQSST